MQMEMIGRKKLNKQLQSEGGKPVTGKCEKMEPQPEDHTFEPPGASSGSVKIYIRP
jgi:hypothetical protein